MRRTGKLSARKVSTLSKAGRHGDGAGLYLSISKAGDTLRRRWVYLFTRAGKLREMGLGGFPEVPLAAARIERDKSAAVLRSGGDPIGLRKVEKAASRGVPTFGQLADEVIEGKGAEWRNEKHRQQWVMTLNEYAAPLRSRPVNEIETDDVLAVLRPIWPKRPETASRLRGRIEHVLDAARARGFRHGPNPALWRGHLDKLLPKRPKVAQGHHAALPYEKVARFIGEVRKRDAVGALAIEFTVLTAARTGEVLGATWDEIDLKSSVWTIPAKRMKASRIHRVPLSGRAVAILRKLERIRRGDFVFPGRKPGRPLSNMSMEMILRRMKVEDATMHGFRSSFRDWVGNETHFPREIAEAALAHVVGDAAEQAYRRGDALEKRRQLMEAWAEYCEPDAAERKSKVQRKTHAKKSAFRKGR
jgi:integrase